MFKPQAKAVDVVNGSVRYGYYRETTYGNNEIEGRIQGDGVKDLYHIVDPLTVKFASGADINTKMIYDGDRLCSKINHCLENSYEVFFCRRTLQWMAKPYKKAWSSLPLHTLLKESNIEFLDEFEC